MTRLLNELSLLYEQSRTPRPFHEQLREKLPFFEKFSLSFTRHRGNEHCERVLKSGSIVYYRKDRYYDKYEDRTMQPYIVTFDGTVVRKFRKFSKRVNINDRVIITQEIILTQEKLEYGYLRKHTCTLFPHGNEK